MQRHHFAECHILLLVLLLSVESFLHNVGSVAIIAIRMFREVANVVVHGLGHLAQTLLLGRNTLLHDVWRKWDNNCVNRRRFTSGRVS